jgi:outer membrane protein TolC
MFPKFSIVSASLAIALCMMPPAHAQTVTLDHYVREGLESNLALQQQNFSYQKSEQALREARGLFFPSLNLGARYSNLSGNVLDFGRLVDPVYATLNQLLQQQAFPVGLNLRLPLQREAKITVTQPLFNLSILHNHRAQSHLREAEAAHLQSFQRQLVADVKTAYLNYAKTVRVVELYRQTIPLLEENLRVNESLFANQKITEDATFRARAELSEVQQKLAEAEQQSDAAAQYFNFLLNRPLDAPIALVPDSSLAVETAVDQARAQAEARSRREELRQLRAGIRAAEAGVKASESRFLPTLGLGIDYGFQGNTYDFDSDQDFLVVSLVAQWNLFNGFQDAARRQQARLETARLQTQEAELKNQIGLQVRTAYNDMMVAQNAIATANDRLASAEKSFELVARKYQLGSAAQIEYLDARTTYTNAGINQILTTYDYYIKYAHFERVVGLYPLEELSHSN